MSPYGLNLPSAVIKGVPHHTWHGTYPFNVLLNSVYLGFLVSISSHYIAFPALPLQGCIVDMHHHALSSQVHFCVLSHLSFLSHQSR